MSINNIYPWGEDSWGDGSWDVLITSTETGASIYPWGANEWGDGSWEVQITTSESYVSAIHSTAVSQGTSLDLVDFDLTYDDSDLAWYTNWFPEEKVLPEQHDLALQMQVAPEVQDPAAIIHVEYDANGNGNVDNRSEPIYVNESELVHDVTGVPSSEDGYYRLRISDYGGYNDIYNINLGIVH